MDIRILHQCEAASQAALSAHARQRLQYRLGQRSAHVRHVEVRLGSASSRHGRQDTYCLMRVQLDGAPAATVVDIGADAFDTIDRAAARVARMAEEQLRLTARFVNKNRKAAAT